MRTLRTDNELRDINDINETITNGNCDRSNYLNNTFMPTEPQYYIEKMFSQIDNKITNSETLIDNLTEEFEIECENYSNLVPDLYLDRVKNLTEKVIKFIAYNIKTSNKIYIRLTKSNSVYIRIPNYHNYDIHYEIFYAINEEDENDIESIFTVFKDKEIVASDMGYINDTLNNLDDCLRKNIQGSCTNLLFFIQYY